MNDVWLIRHGETEWSRAGRHTGRTDVELTALGRERASALAPRLAAVGFALVLTSPLRRAAETCALAGLADAAVDDDDLVEWDYGDYEGRTTETIREARPGWTLWADGVPGGETAAAVAARADRVIARCRGVEGPCALFAHGHVLRVLAARWLDQPPQAGGFYALDPASVSVLGWEREQPVIRRWNG
jgi:probable phosphoglycerate mutase